MAHPTSTQTRLLDAGWQWREANKDQGWTDAQAFPSEVHLELLHKGVIPDPFVGFNEHDVQWVGETEWEYRCAFAYEHDPERPNAVLVFEGLDTICDVFLVPLQSSTLHTTNTLRLHFKSAKRIAKDLENKYGKVRAGSTNLGDPSRVYIRKAQYDWRWDWGPELITCGPYRPIHLITRRARLALTRINASVSAKPDLKPTLSVIVRLDAPADPAQGYAVHAVLRATSGAIVATKVWVVEGGEAALEGLLDGAKDGVEQRWPTGSGKQTLYALELALYDPRDHRVKDSVLKTIGFRRVDLVQEPLVEADRYGTGTTFLFEVNGVRMFMGGSNWIPADSFLTRITPERYRAWLTLLRDGNQNMVRVWGGGIYEPDIFYDICDELGILVWQDFQFACGVYPAHPEFVENVRQEARYNVERLVHHPCLALWCGNNEDYQQVLQWGDVKDLPARILYEHVLPAVVEEISQGLVPYHRGSPYRGQGWDTADPTVGDVHQWDVWGGKELAWQNYGKMGGRFVSEFGMPAMPDIRTIDYWLGGDTTQRWAQSPLMAQHCRAGAHERRFAIAMNENFRLTADFEAHVYHTQIMQSEAVGLAYRMWRREWRGQGKEYCGGVLVWQLNDCWPVTSWALVDYFLRPKPAYHAVKRELAPLTVGIYRTVEKNRPNDRPDQFYEFGAFQSTGATLDVWATNSTLEEVPAILELRAFDLQSDWKWTEKQEIVLAPNQTTEFGRMKCPSPPCPPPRSPPLHSSKSPDLSHRVVVAARLLAPSDDPIVKVLARFADWPQPYRHTDYPSDPSIGVSMHARGEFVTVAVARPVKGLVLHVQDMNGARSVLDEEVEWSDNALDVMPADAQTVVAKGLMKALAAGSAMVNVVVGWRRMGTTGPRGLTF